MQFLPVLCKFSKSMLWSFTFQLSLYIWALAGSDRKEVVYRKNSTGVSQPSQNEVSSLIFQSGLVPFGCNQHTPNHTQIYVWASIIISSGPIPLLSRFLSMNMHSLQIKEERHFLETDQMNKTGCLVCWSNQKKQNELLKFCCKRSVYLLILPEQSAHLAWLHAPGTVLISLGSAINLFSGLLSYKYRILPLCLFLGSKVFTITGVVTHL